MCMTNVSIFTELLPIMVNIILELYPIPLEKLYPIPLGDRDIIVPFTFTQEQGFTSGVQPSVGSRPLELKSSKISSFSSRMHYALEYLSSPAKYQQLCSVYLRVWLCLSEIIFEGALKTRKQCKHGFSALEDMRTDMQRLMEIKISPSHQKQAREKSCFF